MQSSLQETATYTRHPAESCLERLHDSELKKVYWTEKGAGGSPEVNDVVAGTVSIEVAPNATSYTVSYGKPLVTDTYQVKGSPGGAPSVPPTPPSNPGQPRYAYSVKGQLYYYVDCPAVKRISSANLRYSIDPPPDKKPSSCVTDAAK